MSDDMGTAVVTSIGAGETTAILAPAIELTRLLDAAQKFWNFAVIDDEHGPTRELHEELGLALEAYHRRIARARAAQPEGTGDE